jgi:hypothetical protein
MALRVDVNRYFVGQLFHDHVEGKADLDELATGAVALRREIETGADHIRRLTRRDPDRASAGTAQSLTHGRPFPMVPSESGTRGALVLCARRSQPGDIVTVNTARCRSDMGDRRRNENGKSR